MTEDSWRSRWSKDQVRSILLDQAQAFWERPLGVERTRLAELEAARVAPHAVAVSGLRRVGKSTLLTQLAHRLGQDAYYYLNFEDDRLLGFRVDDGDDLHRALVEVFGQRNVFIFDEVQNVTGWERFVRRLMDAGHKVYLTGSNASLLSRELGSLLTGRHIPVELFPFSFGEYLRFGGHGVPDLDRLTTSDGARLLGLLGMYLHDGGLPEALSYPGLPLRRALYDDVLYRDIATRYRVDAVRALKELAFYLMSNPAGSVSYNKLKEHLHLGSVNTVKNYVEYLESSWLIFTLNVFDYSVKRQQIAPKKVYVIDTGLASAVGFAFSPNTGKLLENLVFLALRSRTENIYYWLSAGGREVDFYLPERGDLIQVTQSLSQPSVREREVRALADAMRELGLSRGLILTDAEADPIELDGLTIEVRSVARWLLGG